jgi:hypothetical protein
MLVGIATVQKLECYLVIKIAVAGIPKLFATFWKLRLPLTYLA